MIDRVLRVMAAILIGLSLLVDYAGAEVEAIQLVGIANFLMLLSLMR